MANESSASTTIATWLIVAFFAIVIVALALSGSLFGDHGGPTDGVPETSNEATY